MLSNTQKIWRVVLLTLVAFGLIHILINRTLTALIILAVIGAIFYLYKRPPRWLIRLSYPRGGRIPSKPQSSPKRKKGKRAKKRYPFRVIDGKKREPTRIKKSQ